MTESAVGERAPEPTPPTATSSLDQGPARRGSRTRVPPGQVAAAIVLLIVVAFAVPVWLAHKYGALGVARNDDWSYLRTLFNWVDTGHLDFNNWVSMTLLAQLAIAAPIVLAWGHNITLIQLLTATLGLAGLLTVLRFGYVVTRRFWVAVFVAVLVAAGPLWGALTVSFMTDVPAFAVSMAACAFGLRAINRSRVSLPYVFASMAAGLVGFSIRQYAAVPLVAIVVVAGCLLWKEGSRPRIGAFLAGTAVVVIAAAVFWAYWRTIPHPKAFSPAFPTGYSIRATVNKGGGLVRLLGLLVAPALVLAGPVRILRRSWSVAHDTTVFVGAGVVGGLSLTGFAGPSIGFAGNYIVPDGILSQGVAIGHRPDLFPAGVFSALLVVGTLAAGLLAVATVPAIHNIGRRLRTHDLMPRDPVTAFLGVVAFGYGAAYFLAAISGIPLYDRYVIPAVPIVALLVLREPARAAEPSGRRSTRRGTNSSRGRVAVATAALAALAVVGYAYTADSASFDGARWSVAEKATHEGWAPEQVSGGFEWANFYGFQGSNPALQRLVRHAEICVIVIINPARGAHDPAVIASGYYRPPFHDPVLVVARITSPKCIPANRRPPNPKPAKP